MPEFEVIHTGGGSAGATFARGNQGEDVLAVVDDSVHVHQAALSSVRGPAARFIRGQANGALTGLWTISWGFPTELHARDNDGRIVWTHVMSDGSSLIQKLRYIHNTWILGYRSIFNSTPGEPPYIYPEIYSTDQGETWNHLSVTGVGPVYTGSRWVVANSYMSAATVIYSGTTLGTLATDVGFSDFFNWMAPSYMATDGSGTVVVVGNHSDLLRSTAHGSPATWGVVSPTYPISGSGATRPYLWTGLTYFNGEFVGLVRVMQSAAPNYHYLLARSSNGASWSFTTLTTDNFATSPQLASNDDAIAYYITLGLSRDLYASSDATTWTHVPVTFAATSLKTTSDGMLNLSNNATLLRSSDGISWSHQFDVDEPLAPNQTLIGFDDFEVGPLLLPDDVILQKRVNDTWSIVDTYTPKVRPSSGYMATSHLGRFRGAVAYVGSGLVYPYTFAERGASYLSADGDTWIGPGPRVAPSQTFYDPLSDTWISPPGGILGGDNAIYKMVGSSSGTPETTGIFRSVDGGSNWVQILEGTPENFDGWDPTGINFRWSLAYARDLDRWAVSRYGTTNDVTMWFMSDDPSAPFTKVGEIDLRVGSQRTFISAELSGDGCFYWTIDGADQQGVDWIVIHFTDDAQTWRTSFVDYPHSSWTRIPYTVRCRGLIPRLITPPLRLRQRNDAFNAPRAAGRAGNSPTSRQYSIREGKNTYL